MPTLFSIILAMTLLGCTRTPEEASVRAREQMIHARIVEIEKQIKAYDEKIKAASSDHGLQAQLRSDQELARARLARMKMQLPDASAPGSSSTNHH